MGAVQKSRPAVYGVEQETLRVRMSAICAVHENGKKPIAEIEMRSGRIIRGFADSHPVLTWRGWVRTADLKVGDAVVGSLVLPLCGSATEIDRRDAYVVGALLGIWG